VALSKKLPLAEDKFQATGLVDDTQVVTLGRKMGADKVCVTSISKLDNVYYISCKMIDVATARIDSQKTGKTKGGGSNIVEVVVDLLMQILQ
jgi:hypothetical protein